MFFKRFIAQTVYTVCTRISYRIVPVTNLNKYLHCGKVELNNMYIDVGANNGSENYKKKTLRLPASQLTLRRLMSYIYGAPILDVSRSHTTTQHSR